ncbi:MAG: hypothetical protein C5S48_06315 [Candidatus Methanogaster sp.]|nr:MAG: hypothetical protein C5S48_06315 [ANME-2 cluster archaeon]
MGFNNNIESPEKFCSNCGEQIDVRAEICPHCGVRVAIPTSVKNPAVAVILSFFVVGLGQVYNGKYKTAILMFVLAVISAMLWSVGIGVITSLIIWIWSMSDAWNVAKGTGGSTSGSVSTVVMAVVGFFLICALMAMIGAFVFGMGDSMGGDTATSTKAPTGATIKTPAKELVSTSFSDFGAVYCDADATNLQKQTLFDDQFKNKYVKWSGTVSSVSDTWGSYTLQVKHCPDTWVSDIVVTMRADQKNELLQLREGDRVTYIAKLTRCGDLLGISAEDGEIVRD